MFTSEIDIQHVKLYYNM